MRLIFFGTPEFAAQILDDLLKKGFPIVAVVTQPDKPQGRSKTPVASPVKERALAAGLPCLQPARASSPDSIATLSLFQPDAFIVVAYGQLLSQSLLNVPPLGTINVHASILPFYRGAAPIQRVLMNGEKETGVTIMKMVLAMDAGPILAIQRIPIELTTTFGELKEQLCQISKPLLSKTLTEYFAGKATPQPQDETLVTYAPKVNLEDTQLAWDKPAMTLHNLIRASNPEPGAWTIVSLKGQPKKLRILRSFPVEGEGLPGQILQWRPRWVVGTGKGALEILEVQLEGKKPISSQAFTCGYQPNDLCFS